MQLNLGRGTLEALERELLPVALGHPQKPLYRRLLVDLYGAMAFPLVQRVRYGNAQEASSARDTLTKMGARAVKPLLDALGDDNQQQQTIAIEVLAFVENKNAGPSLFAFATGNADQTLRVRAMIACGALRDPALLPKYKSLLVPSGDAPPILGGPIAVGAAWGVARMQDKRAAPLLVELAKGSTPELRALALLGLGVSQDKTAATIAAEVASSPDAGNVARAAAAWALSELGATQHSDVLLAMARSQDALPRQASLLALSHLDPARARIPVAEALFDSNPSVRRAAFAASALQVTKQAKRSTEPFAVPDSMVDVRAIIENMIPTPASPSQRVRALIALEEPITRAAVDATRTSPERAMLVADALLSRPNAPGLAPFTDGVEGLTAAEATKVEEVCGRITKALSPAFGALLRHPLTDLRIRAVRVLAKVNDPASHEAIVDALTDDDEAVQRAALAVLSEIRSEAATKAVAKILAGNPNWALRVRAARALGSLKSAQPDRDAVASLSRAAKDDKFALVRQASMEALAKLSPSDARPVLEAIANSDPEPEIRRAAKNLIAK
jgi:HEAT repeat protein